MAVEDDAATAEVTEEAGAGGVTDGALRGSVDRNPFVPAHTDDGEILGDDSIDTCGFEILDQLLRRREFLIEKEGVDGSEDARAETVGI